MLCKETTLVQVFMKDNKQIFFRSRESFQSPTIYGLTVPTFHHVFLMKYEDNKINISIFHY